METYGAQEIQGQTAGKNEGSPGQEMPQRNRVNPNFAETGHQRLGQLLRHSHPKQQARFEEWTKGYDKG